MLVVSNDSVAKGLGGPEGVALLCAGAGLQLTESSSSEIKPFEIFLTRSNSIKARSK